MHVGLIVGIGPAATDFYYRRIIEVLAMAGVPLDLTMAHADTSTLLRNQAAGDRVAQVAIYLRLAKRLKAAGASALAITSIAGHFCIGEFVAVSPLPVIDLLSVVNRDLIARDLRRVGILGTRVVMETRFYGAAAMTEIIPPPAGEALQAVHDAYVAMASSGSITATQRDIFFSAGRAMMRDCGAEAIMLGGTDLALAFAGHDPGFPIFDCAAIHADAIAAAAMS
jgi:aspartate racemase